jgi:hypothetical protein
MINRLKQLAGLDDILIEGLTDDNTFSYKTGANMTPDQVRHEYNKIKDHILNSLTPDEEQALYFDYELRGEYTDPIDDLAWSEFIAIFGFTPSDKLQISEASVIPKPKYKVTLKGTPMSVTFDVNNNPTKRGIKMRFNLLQGGADVNSLNNLANEMTVILQKKFADKGLQINRDTEVEDPSTIGFIIPIASITDFIMNKVIKGQ